MSDHEATAPDRRRLRVGAAGQILPIFALSLTVLVSMGGLAIDAGGVYAQRRTQQVASDLAALAGANDYLINGDDDRAIAQARSVAADNGFSSGTGGTTVDVTIDTSNGVEVSVQVAGVHQNALLRIVGLPTWGVATSAAALAGFPDSAHGAAPFIFSIGAFEDDGTPKYQSATNFGEDNGDVPTSELDFAWTNYGTGNVNTNEVRHIIDGTMVVDKTLTYGEYIGQHNNGNHTTLFDEVDTHLSGGDLPVADRRHERQLHGLGDVPRQQRVRRFVEARQRVLPQLVLERAPDGLVVRGERLPALPRELRPQAVRLIASSVRDRTPRRGRRGRVRPPPTVPSVSRRRGRIVGKAGDEVPLGRDPVVGIAPG